ncbi:AraC family transcriptional regulator [Flavobacterium sp.]|uniref:helix-turn-helix domain-containing protein n=1 Tax=Flavobacterium sp. TaxID=239 RepID=UPI0026076A00|nr:AraC family transcriptional regulator [Flavobacterium sp.]
MIIQTLPEELTKINHTEIQLYEYHISQSLEKNKVQLSTNVFSFLIEGTKELITNNSSTTIESDKFLIIKSGNCLMSENISLSQNYKSMLLFFSDDMLKNFIDKYGLKTDSKATLSDFLICDYDPTIIDFVKSLESLKQQPTDFLEKILPIKFEEVLLYLVQKKGANFLSEFINTNKKTSDNFVNIVKKNALNNLKINEIAFLCNMSTSTFKRYFEKEFKTSPNRWFLEKRLEHATYLLNSKNLRPSDIYHQVGFENLSSFIQAFKHQFGQTPKQWQISN